MTAYGETLTFSISGGVDAGSFTIDPGTGVLSFVTGPDFEAPADAGTDNIYDVTVRVTDSLGAFDEQAVEVHVTPVNEFAPVFGGDNSGTVTEDGDLDDAGLLTVSDGDTGESEFQPGPASSAATVASISLMAGVGSTRSTTV